ncbi:MAG: RNA pyrophosphohydrolase [Alphaproteobacteria bacterium]|nr:RNA pyrophosphohydrolase [Alphaproteobacteria bacterium]
MDGIDLQKLPYRRGVGLCLFNPEGLVLMAERRDRPGAWQMPQGGVQREEDIRVAALREMKEEIGTDAARIVAKLPHKTTYEFPDWLQNRRLGKDASTGAVIFRGKYRGQEQDWFALMFEGRDSDIDLSGEHEPELPEFVAWKWVELAETPSMIVPFKKPVYEAVVAGFAHVEIAIRGGEKLPAWQG